MLRIEKAILVLATLSALSIATSGQAQFVLQQAIAVESSTSSAQGFLRGTKGTSVLLIVEDHGDGTSTIKIYSAPGVLDETEGPLDEERLRHWKLRL